MRKEDEEEDYLDDSESKQCLLLVFFCLQVSTRPDRLYHAVQI